MFLKFQLQICIKIPSEILGGKKMFLPNKPYFLEIFFNIILEIINDIVWSDYLIEKSDVSSNPSWCRTDLLKDKKKDLQYRTFKMYLLIILVCGFFLKPTNNKPSVRLLRLLNLFLDNIYTSFKRLAFSSSIYVMFRYT